MDESKEAQSGNSSALVNQEMTDGGTAATTPGDKALPLSPSDVIHSIMSVLGWGEGKTLPCLCWESALCRQSALQELVWKKNFPCIKIKPTLCLESSSYLFPAG